MGKNSFSLSDVTRRRSYCDLSDEEKKKIVYLKNEYGLSYRIISNRMSVSENAIGQVLKEAREVKI